MLEKKGNSNSDERMDLLDQFYNIFPDAQVAYLTGDREFVGKRWLTSLLIEPAISFRLRIRHSNRIFNGKKQLRVSIIFANLKSGQTRVLSGRKLVRGRSVYVSSLRLDDGELLVVASFQIQLLQLFQTMENAGVLKLYLECLKPEDFVLSLLILVILSD